MQTLQEFKTKFLADNPAIAGPLQLLGQTGAGLIKSLDDIIEKAYADYVEEEEKGKSA